MIAATVWLCTTAWAIADDLAVNDNPYTPIVTRNAPGSAARSACNPGGHHPGCPSP